MNKIDYIEFWATKHCNLNCKGCSSCSPISEEWFLEPDALKRDLNRLKELEIDFNNINILGGEPLLHPNLLKIFEVVKTVYPDCKLGLLTNGLLLTQMDDLFWKMCSEYKIMLKVTCFPILAKEEVSKIRELMNFYNVEYHLTNKTKFNKILVENNSDNLEDIISACGCNYAYNLYNGQISRCTVPMITETFNKYFHTNLITEGKINIYESTAEEIMVFLAMPNKSCLNCSSKPIKVEWGKAGKNPQKYDWIIGETEYGI